METPLEALNEVQDQQSFLCFVKALIADFERNAKLPILR